LIHGFRNNVAHIEATNPPKPLDGFAKNFEKIFIGRIFYGDLKATYTKQRLPSPIPHDFSKLAHWQDQRIIVPSQIKKIFVTCYQKISGAAIANPE
jgi:hypothetical protein